jgi:casein kinase II subunit beta
MSDDASQIGWIRWFCSLEGHEFLAEVDEEFIKDQFNLYGL